MSEAGRGHRVSFQNSFALMGQRISPLDGLDDFPTPPWATRALAEIVLPRIVGKRPFKLCEPASNRGYMAKALREYYRDITTLDIFDYRNDPETFEPQQHVADFLSADLAGFDGYITNPPFRLAPQFIAHAMRQPGWRVIAVLVRTQFLEGGERYRELYRSTPPHVIAQFVERVPMLKGRLRRRQINPKTGKIEAVTTATSYAWLVFLPDEHCEDPRFRWIEPCRPRLERFGDYPDDVFPHLLGAGDALQIAAQPRKAERAPDIGRSEERPSFDGAMSRGILSAGGREVGG